MNQYLKRIIHKIYIYGKDIDQKMKYAAMREKYELHSSFRFNGENVLFYGEGKIIIGANSYIGSMSAVQSFENCTVRVGNNCQISHNVRIYTQSLVADQDLGLYKLETYIGDVTIEDNVWIGANVFINPGIKIGNNAIIGANSVVTKDVGEFEIFGGFPAKLIRTKRLDSGA